MCSLVHLVLFFCLANLGWAQAEIGCDALSAPTTDASCTVFYTHSMPPQIGPTSTVYAQIATTKMNVVDCNYCQITNIAQNPVPKGPFTTKVTSRSLLVTQVGCIPQASTPVRRHALPEMTPEPTTLYIIRGAKPATLIPMVNNNAVARPKLSKLVGRQSPPTNASGPPLILMGEPFRLIQQLFTVLYSIGLVNSGGDLGESCLQLQSANAILDLARVGLNASQAAAIVCTASLPGSSLARYNQTLIASAAAGLYAIQLAANFTGTVDTAVLCTQLELSPLPAFGVDIVAVRNYVCSAKNNGTVTNSSTVAGPTNFPSVGTLTPFPSTNASGGFTWAGSLTGSLTGSGTIGTAASGSWGTGTAAQSGSWATGIPASGTGPFPAGNDTGSYGVNATGILPTGTGVYATGSIAGSGANILPTGYASGASGSSNSNSDSDSKSSVGGYEVERETSDRVPRGPTSTPRYYPKYL